MTTCPKAGGRVRRLHQLSNAAELPQLPTFVDPQAAICWSANLQPQIKSTFKMGSLIGRGSGESFQLAFHGPGFVVVQPSEGQPRWRLPELGSYYGAHEHQHVEADPQSFSLFTAVHPADRQGHPERPPSQHWARSPASVCSSRRRTARSAATS
ncbi:AIM24 family protein [Actinomyces viscosus]|nr:AIM24 family protein [Actinomyces viscosus]